MKWTVLHVALINSVANLVNALRRVSCVMAPPTVNLQMMKLIAVSTPKTFNVLVIVFALLLLWCAMDGKIVMVSLFLKS